MTNIQPVLNQMSIAVPSPYTAQICPWQFSHYRQQYLSFLIRDAKNQSKWQ
jgi:hypothetical protein